MRRCCRRPARSRPMPPSRRCSSSTLAISKRCSTWSRRRARPCRACAACSTRPGSRHSTDSPSAYAPGAVDRKPQHLDRGRLRLIPRARAGRGPGPGRPRPSPSIPRRAPTSPGRSPASNVPWATVTASRAPLERVRTGLGPRRRAVHRYLEPRHPDAGQRRRPARSNLRPAAPARRRARPRPRHLPALPLPADSGAGAPTNEQHRAVPPAVRRAPTARAVVFQRLGERQRPGGTTGADRRVARLPPPKRRPVDEPLGAGSNAGGGVSERARRLPCPFPIGKLDGIRPVMKPGSAMSLRAGGAPSWVTTTTSSSSASSRSS